MGYKDEYADAIEGQFYDLEKRILDDIVRRIKKTGEVTSTADWQINRLAALGYSSDEIESMIKDALNATYPEMFELYDKVADWEYVRNKELYEQINGKFIPYKENQQLQQWLLAAKAQTAATLQNLTKTMGVVDKINGQYTFLPLTEFYHKTLDAAVLDITSGAFDYNSVLKRAVSTLSRSGIRAVDYASGYSSRLPVAVRRAVMTGVSQLAGQIADMNAEELGTDYFEIDWHEGARPSHRKWQGRVWNRQELVTVCGLGTVTGLKGANCYHDYYPFIPGISERNYTDEELAELDRKEDIKRRFKGKEYNAYEARQKQRQMETSMRAQRQKVRMIEDGGADRQDIIIAKARYQGQLAEYKQFSDAMKLKPHMERVYIDGLGRVALGRKMSPIVNAGGSGIIRTGAISGALNPFSEAAQRHADQYYEAVRHMKNDAAKIADSVGWKQEAIEKIKRYIFVDEHNLLDGKSRFFPSYAMAQSWQRLIDGKNIQEQDLVLLKHEYLEMKLVERGMTQDKAHIIASKKHNFAKYLE